VGVKSQRFLRSVGHMWMSRSSDDLIHHPRHPFMRYSETTFGTANGFGCATRLAQ
jgi:hypothetical protein